MNSSAMSKKFNQVYVYTQKIKTHEVTNYRARKKKYNRGIQITLLFSDTRKKMIRVGFELTIFVFLGCCFDH